MDRNNSVLRLEKYDGTFFISLRKPYNREIDTRYLWNESVPTELVDWWGEDYDARVLSSDFDLAIEAFRQFFFDGDVSEDILR